MPNAKDSYNIVLNAYVTASAQSEDDKWVKLSAIEELINERGVTFTSGSADKPQPMTERAQKLVCGASVRQFKKGLADAGQSEEAIEKEVKSLGLKKVKCRPKMTKDDGFDFDAFRKKLKASANS